MKSGHTMIAAERGEQMTKHRYSNEHDDAYENDELVRAARCYMLKSAVDGPGGPPAGLAWAGFEGEPPTGWPWDKSFWRPGNRIQNLKKAGALIAAEIDRELRQIERSAQLCEIERKAWQFGKRNPFPWYRVSARREYMAMIKDVLSQAESIKRRRRRVILENSEDATEWPALELEQIVLMKNRLEQTMTDAEIFAKTR